MKTRQVQQFLKLSVTNQQTRWETFLYNNWYIISGFFILAGVHPGAFFVYKETLSEQLEVKYLIYFSNIFTGSRWVGWNNSTIGPSPVEIELEFDGVREFQTVHIHTNNMFSRRVQVSQNKYCIFIKKISKNVFSEIL